jgi:hypothetical protein
MNAWTDGLRQGFVLTMNAGWRAWPSTEWAALSEFDRSRLARAGITEADWKALGAVPPPTSRAASCSRRRRSRKPATPIWPPGLRPHRRRERVRGGESGPGHARGVTMGGQQAGTWGGELARTVMQFKSFPIAMFTRHWARMLEATTAPRGAPLLANRSAYGFALMATLAGLGAWRCRKSRSCRARTRST